ncbi:MAG: NADH:ubiquinone reductase (Na(+)-transporting) subunit E [Candidatus Omnitrophica bacterium]|nr:NADH:ubiquinone reductase (Na(+)-transporting) subunit E [Candidatus Omnitrophota bacterium]
MIYYVNLLVKSIFIENILLVYFLGMCSFLGCSKRTDAALGMGAAVVFISTVCTPACWAVKHFFLKKGAMSWAGLPGLDLSFLIFITFIAVIAAVNQLTEMIVEKVSPPLYNKLGIFLPLIVVNCAILGAAFFMDQREYTLAESLVWGFGSGTGWALAIVALATIRKRLGYSNIPGSLRGGGIAMIITGLMALGFMCFSGISL